MPEHPAHSRKDTAREECAPPVADEAPAAEHGNARAELGGRVPPREEIQRAGVERGLDEAEEEAHSERACEVGAYSRQS